MSRDINVGNRGKLINFKTIMDFQFISDSSSEESDSDSVSARRKRKYLQWFSNVCYIAFDSATSATIFFSFFTLNKLSLKIS